MSNFGKSTTGKGLKILGGLALVPPAAIGLGLYSFGRGLSNIGAGAVLGARDMIEHQHRATNNTYNSAPKVSEQRKDELRKTLSNYDAERLNKFKPVSPNISTINPSSLTGYTPRQFNKKWGDRSKSLDWLLGNTDKVRDNLVRQMDGVSYTPKSSFTPNMNGYSQVSEKNRKLIAQANRNDYANTIRNYGDNTDPFNNSKEARLNRAGRNFQEKALRTDKLGTIEKKFADMDKTLRGVNNLNDYYKLRDEQSPIKEALTKERQTIQNRLNYKNDTLFEYSKDYKPREGMNGFGLGMSNYLRASRQELLGRAIHFSNPFGASGRELLMNSFGLTTRTQKAVFAQAMNKGILAKLGTNYFQTKAGMALSLGHTIATGGEATDLVENAGLYYGSMYGWRVGTSVAGAMTKPRIAPIGIKELQSGGLNGIRALAGSGVARGAVGLIGGLTGFAAGALISQGVISGVSDMFSNESNIRKIAKDFTKRTSTMSTMETKQTLTARQSALAKLAKSGLNDRATLLSNEAMILRQGL